MTGSSGVTNPRLREYGIQTEKSDYRVHVCPESRCVYVFKTDAGRRCLEGRAPVPGRQPVNGKPLVTASGVLVPWSEIDGIQELRLSKKWFESFPPSSSTTSEKGEAATQIAKLMFTRGLVLVPLLVEVCNVMGDQLDGVDLVARTRIKIQVKCDYKGGEKRRGGTGNLYLQTAESNPLKRY